MTPRRELVALAVMAPLVLAAAFVGGPRRPPPQAPSADIVFVSRDSGSSSTQLYTIGADGSRRTRLTHNDLYSYNMPVWSPDHRWIAAVRWRTVGSQGTDLVLVRPTDGTDSVLVHFPSETWFPDWSADGTRLVVVAGAQYPAWAVMVVRLATQEVRQVLAADTAITRFMPTWTHDGSLLVAENTKCRTRILRVDPQSGRTTVLLATDSIWLSTPVESPDAAHILLSGSAQSPCTPLQAMRPNLDQDVYVMNVDGSRLLRLTADPLLSNSARWSPDGRAIVFASDQHASRNTWATFLDSTELYVMRPDGTGIRRLTWNQLPDLHPHW